MSAQSLGWEEPLEEGVATHLQYCCLENPMDREEPGGLQSIGSQKVGHGQSDLANGRQLMNKIFLGGP